MNFDEKVMLGDQEWIVLSGLDEVTKFCFALFLVKILHRKSKQIDALHCLTKCPFYFQQVREFTSKEESTSHLPSQTFNDLYSWVNLILSPN